MRVVVYWFYQPKLSASVWCKCHDGTDGKYRLFYYKMDTRQSSGREKPFSFPQDVFLAFFAFKIDVGLHDLPEYS